jgi:hypothetical protein
MINDFRFYKYYTYGDLDEYGQLTLPTIPEGQIFMSIHLTSQSIQDNINYSGAQYVGITHAKLTDKNLIEYNGKKLKVLYINDKGRYNQVFMAET